MIQIRKTTLLYIEIVANSKMDSFQFLLALYVLSSKEETFQIDG